MEINESNNEEEETNNNHGDLFQKEDDLDNDGNLSNQDDSNEEEDEIGHGGTNLPEADQRRYPLSNRRKKKRLVVDFKGRKYHISDMVIHINPWIVEQAEICSERKRIH